MWLFEDCFENSARDSSSKRLCRFMGAVKRERTEALNLQPGEWVQVRSKDEIARTLDENGFDRGLSFDWEMLPDCGRKYRVRDRIDRIINDKTGRMIEIASDCVMLDEVVCSGERSTGRWFCQGQFSRIGAKPGSSGPSPHQAVQHPQSRGPDAVMCALPLPCGHATASVYSREVRS